MQTTTNTPSTEERILITGASGFLGSALTQDLLLKKQFIRVVTRNSNIVWEPDVDVVKISGIESNTDWKEPLQDITTVIHCAARVHVMKDKSTSPIDEFRKVNVLGTTNLIKQAINSGVKRFIFISSIGVNGSETFEHPFYADDIPSPATPYAISKMEAEQSLIKLAQSSKLEFVIIRPPLIYGKGAPGNFSTLMRTVNLRIPLPLGRLKNLRSFIAIDNLVDIVTKCIEHPNAANQVFLVSDGQDISTSDFIHKIAAAQKKTIVLIPATPILWIEKLINMVNKQNKIRKLTGNLQINIDKTRELLTWEPIITIEDAMIKAVESKEKYEN
jgi:UDP-N-acetyl-alpha-D-quinovosamine dehydrogenase